MSDDWLKYMSVDNIINLYKTKGELNTIINDWNLWSYLAQRDFRFNRGVFVNNNHQTNAYNRYLQVRDFINRGDDLIKLIDRGESPINLIKDLSVNDILELYRINYKLSKVVNDWNLWSYLANRDFNFPQTSFRNYSSIDAYGRYSQIRDVINRKKNLVN